MEGAILKRAAILINGSELLLLLLVQRQALLYISAVLLRDSLSLFPL